jgi:hypothetical protein
VCSRQRYLWQDAPLPQRKDHRVRRDGHARQARPEIPAQTQTGAERTSRSVPTSREVRTIKNEVTTKSISTTKNVPMTKNAPTRKTENLAMLVVRRESTFIQILMEERLASETNRVTGNFLVQVQSSLQLPSQR